MTLPSGDTVACAGLNGIDSFTTQFERSTVPITQSQELGVEKPLALRENAFTRARVAHGTVFARERLSLFAARRAIDRRSLGKTRESTSLLIFLFDKTIDRRPLAP